MLYLTCHYKYLVSTYFKSPCAISNNVENVFIVLGSSVQSAEV